MRVSGLFSGRPSHGGSSFTHIFRQRGRMQGFAYANSLICKRVCVWAKKLQPWNTESRSTQWIAPSNCCFINMFLEDKFQIRQEIPNPPRCCILDVPRLDLFSRNKSATRRRLCDLQVPVKLLDGLVFRHGQEILSSLRTGKWMS